MDIFLETDRLVFRQFEETDIDFIRELDSDPIVMKYISNGNPSDNKEVTRAMNVFMKYQQKFDGKLGYWIAIEKENQNVIGWFHMRPLHSDRENLNKLELGFRLKEEFWGKGYASEGSLALIEKTKSLFSPFEICAHSILNNEASRKVMEKAGLSYSHADIYPEFPGEDKRIVWYSLKF